MQWRLLFPASAVAVSIVPVVYGLPRVRRWDPAPRMLWIWLAAAAALNVTSMALSLQGIPSYGLALYGLPVLAVLAIEAMGRLTGSPLLLRWYRIGAGTGILGAILAILLLEKGGGFDHYVTPGCAALLTITAAILLVARVQSGVPHLLRDTGILAGLAVLLLSAPTALVFPLTAPLRRDHPSFLHVLYSAQSVLDVCGSLITLVALRWAPIAPR